MITLMHYSIMYSLATCHLSPLVQVIEGNGKMKNCKKWRKEKPMKEGLPNIIVHAMNAMEEGGLSCGQPFANTCKQTAGTLSTTNQFW